MDNAMGQLEGAMKNIKKSKVTSADEMVLLKNRTESLKQHCESLEAQLVLLKEKHEDLSSRVNDALPVPKIGTLRICRATNGFYGVDKFHKPAWADKPLWVWVEGSYSAMPIFLWPFGRHQRRKQWALKKYGHQSEIVDEVHIETD